MSQTITTTVRGTLELIFRNGPYGAFPVGTLKSNIGTFACRDEWLEALDEGSYEGEFDLSEIKLCSYPTKNYVPEIRCYNRAFVQQQRFDNMSDEVEPTEFEFLDDPILEGKPVVPEPIQVKKPLPQEDEDDDLPDWLKDDKPSLPKLFDNDDVPEMVLFIREKLHSVGNDTEWNLGDNLTIPSEIDRIDQRTIVKYLKDNDYRVIDPNQRIWGLAAEVEYA